jgi:hypothetical protein
MINSSTGIQIKNNHNSTKILTFIVIIQPKWKMRWTIKFENLVELWQLKYKFWLNYDYKSWDFGRIMIIFNLDSRWTINHIVSWNKHSGHKNPEKFAEQDSQLENQIYKLNGQIRHRFRRSNSYILFVLLSEVACAKPDVNPRSSSIWELSIQISFQP